MPFAPVDDHGTVFEYEDTGVPPGSTSYITLLLFHGVQFNSGVFRRMIPFAASSNLRLLLVNFREHGQSTPFTDEELKSVLSGEKAAQADFMKLRVLELATFMVWYIQKEHIPPFEDIGGKLTGGLSLVTWSGSSAFGVTFFGFAEVIPRQQRELIGRHMRSCVLYDPAQSTVGAPFPSLDELYNIILDPAVTDEEKANAWVPKLVGKYPQHAPYAAKVLSVTTLAELPPLPVFLKKLQTMPDIMTWDPATLDSISDKFPVWRSFMPIILINTEIYAECLERLLTRGYRPGEEAERYFPRVKIEFVGYMSSLPECVYGTFWFKRIILQHQAEGKETREVNIRIVEEASHAWHWVEPEKTTKLLAAIV